MLREVHVGRVPIARIFDEPHAVEEAPLAEQKGAVAHEVRGIRGPVGVRLHRGRCTGSSVAKAQRSRKYAVGFSRVTSSGPRIGRAHADLRRILQLAFIEGLRVLQVVELRGVLARGLGRERAAPRVNEIAGGDRLAIAPDGVRPQVEGVVQAVRRHLPALRDAGAGLALLVESGEPLVNGVADAAGGLRRDHRGIEHLRLGAVDQDQLRAVHGPAATGERQREPAEHQVAEGAAHGPIALRASSPAPARQEPERAPLRSRAPGPPREFQGQQKTAGWQARRTPPE